MLGSQLFIDDLMRPNGLLALVVDDSETARAQKIGLLEQGGFRVIPANDEISAEREFLASPAISIALVDINLHPDRGADRSGLDLARRLRSTSPRLPIIGYSAYFAEDDSVFKQHEPFTSTFARGGASSAEIIESIGKWQDAANEYWQFRVQHARTKLEELRSSYGRGPIDFNVVRLLTPSHEATLTNGETTVEETLQQAGYRLRVVERGQRRPTISGTDVGVSRAIWIWTKDAGDHYVAEIYGYPELYSIGETESDALHDLLLLMDGFYDDLASDTCGIGSSRLEALRQFLCKTLGTDT